MTRAVWLVAAAVIAVLTMLACSGKKKAPPASGSGSGAGSGPDGPAASAPLETLVEGVVVRGWKPAAVYLDDAGAAVGARFVHVRTGFQLDYLQIESAPQGFLWVNSFPTSDKGEPHTQEHLLLGKGDRGRKLGSGEAMALAHSSAFTLQWRTAYHFHTVAGNDVFWTVLEHQLDALLHPDYTDEEIRREVRNFGVDRGSDGKLRLEEKGTVYNEMVRTYESPDTVLWRAAGRLVYGAGHPLALDSGGHPDAIRTMTPADIRAFHAQAYHLANMGLIGAFPRSLSVESVLAGVSSVLDARSDARAARAGKPTSEASLPPPAPAAPGTTQLVDYPYSDSANPGPMMLAWPASRKLDAADRVLLALFLAAFAGDESTTLYRKLIDGKTRAIELGANAVSAMLSSDQGEPILLWLSGVKPDKLAAIGDVRAIVAGELTRLARLADGDPELVAFNRRVTGRIVDLRRRLAKFLDSPPGFGLRGTGSSWLDHLRELERVPGFRKSLTMRPALAEVERVLAGKANPWRDRLAAWGLLEPPYGAAARPSPELRKQLDRERQQRIDGELARLAALYRTATPAATLARYQVDYDAATRQIEDAAKAVPLPPLVDSPPMTLDGGLRYTSEPIAGTPALRATIDTMASARIALAFRLDAVAPAHQVYLAMLPALLEGAGVIEGGTPVSAADMKERLRRDILALSVGYTGSLATGRVELVIAGSGNNPAETREALAWMGRVMFAPDWRIENLPRLRDVVDHALTALRQTMLGPEESWVLGPRDAWWRQSWPLHARTHSFLTQAHDVHRLRWMLGDPGDAKVTEETVGWLRQLAEARTLARPRLAALAAALATGAAGDPDARRWTAAAGKLSPAGQAIAKQAGKDLGVLLSDLPDGSLAGDWLYLCRQMAHDLGAGAPAALAALAELRAQVLAGPRRIYQVGADRTLTALAGDVGQLLGRLPPAGPPRADLSGPRFIAERLAQRDPSATAPRHVGLVAPATSSGVFANLVPAPSYLAETDDEVLDYLASTVFSGHGAHSLFMKTWAAGLAYSNGLHPFVHIGALEYYAERCPALPQTLRFVIDELTRARPDPNLARYAIATAFSSRIASSYEGRASAMAADLADGVTPARVTAFRTRLLALAKRPDLAEVLFARMPKVLGKVLPGYGPPPAADDGRFSFTIGPDKQLAAYADYLRATLGKDAALHRLYPRDYWIAIPACAADAAPGAECLR